METIGREIPEVAQGEAESPSRDAEIAYVSELVARAAGGDEQAWREIIGVYSRRVYALCRSRCKDHDASEEITQSVFVTVAQKLSGGEYGEEGKFEPWLFRITANRVRDYIRRLKHRPTAQDPDVLDVSHAAPSLQRDAPELEASRDRTSRLRHAMDQLSESDREVVELRHHAGLSFKQIADTLGEPLGTLLARHHRALRKMKEVMGDWERGPAAVRE
jgi:RNA polymerase sigma-70 factor (ECF subfamily)